jgi:DNA primase
VRLPEGLDPDDLLKAKGTRALQDLLAEARSLVEVLWEAERDAVPLSTPEDKAGLKARLMAHVETIQNPDIASLYRRELQDRYSAFAFPKRESQWQPNSGGGGFQQNRQSPRGGGKWNARPRPEPSSPESISRLNTRHGHGAARDALSAAVIAGLMRWPAMVSRYAEALARTPGLDPRFELLVDCCSTLEARLDKLETTALAPILLDNGLAEPLATEYAGLRFGFLISDTSEEQAGAELAQAIDLLIERPVLEAALAQATARLESELSEAAFTEQQRLLKRKLEFDSRLRQMATRHAS